MALPLFSTNSRQWRCGVQYKINHVGSGNRKKSELESWQFPAFRLNDQAGRPQVYRCYSLHLLTSFLPPMASASWDAEDSSHVRDVCLHRSWLPSFSHGPSAAGRRGWAGPAEWETLVALAHLVQGSKPHKGILPYHFFTFLTPTSGT